MEGVTCTNFSLNESIETKQCVFIYLYSITTPNSSLNLSLMFCSLQWFWFNHFLKTKLNNLTICLNDTMNMNTFKKVWLKKWIYHLLCNTKIHTTKRSNTKKVKRLVHLDKTKYFISCFGFNINRQYCFKYALGNLLFILCKPL